MFLGYVPIMLRSRFCVLADKDDRALCELCECIYDQGGYFVINGSEKVLVAQEHMSNNHVYCFRKSQPHKFSWVVECRSQVDSGARPTSTMYMQMYQKPSAVRSRAATSARRCRTSTPTCPSSSSSARSASSPTATSSSTSCTTSPTAT